MYGVPSRLPSRSPGTLQLAFGDTGYNTGNLLIGYSVRQQMPIVEEQMYGSPFDPDRINAEFDAVIIAASNFVNAYQDHSHLLSIFRRLRIPVITIGLGAQISLADKRLELSRANCDFFRCLADKSKSVGVRGSTTAELLHSIGIRNVEIIGCPTCFLSCRPDFSVRKRATGNPPRWLFNYERHPDFVQLLRSAIRQSVPLVLQTEIEELLLCQSPPPARKDFLSIETYYAEAGFDFDEEVLPYIRQYAKVFFDIPDWMAFAREFDLAVGTRMHGNMLAFQSGVPAWWIRHDGRTAELIHALHLPSVSLADLTRWPLVELYKSVSLEPFNAVYPTLYANYRAFLEQNRLEHRLPPAITPSQRPRREGQGMSIEVIDKAERFEKAPVSVYFAPINSDFPSAITYRSADLAAIEVVDRGVELVSVGGDPHFVLAPFGKPHQPFDHFLVHVHMTSSIKTMFQLFWRINGQSRFVEECSVKGTAVPGENHFYYDLPGDFSGWIRIDPGVAKGRFTLHALEVKAVPAASVAPHSASLLQRCRQAISRSRSHTHAQS